MLTGQTYGSKELLCRSSSVKQKLKQSDNFVTHLWIEIYLMPTICNRYKETEYGTSCILWLNSVTTDLSSTTVAVLTVWLWSTSRIRSFVGQPISANKQFLNREFKGLTGTPGTAVYRDIGKPVIKDSAWTNVQVPVPPSVGWKYRKSVIKIPEYRKRTILFDWPNQPASRHHA